jgi:hypothetical protein
MDRNERLVGRIVAVEHDFPDQDMCDALLGSGLGPWRVPSRRQIAGKCHQGGTVNLGAPRRGGIMPGDAILDMGHLLQRRVPAGLELARDQTLGRIDELVAAAGQGGLITRFLKLAAQRCRTSLSAFTDCSAAWMAASTACSETASTICAATARSIRTPPMPMHNHPPT